MVTKVAIRPGGVGGVLVSVHGLLLVLAGEEPRLIVTQVEQPVTKQLMLVKVTEAMVDDRDRSHGDGWRL